MRGEHFALIYGSAIALWLTAWRLASNVRGPLARIALLALVPLGFIAVLLPAYPLLSSDLFKYVFDGRILATYGLNPFTHVPVEFPDDRFYDLVYWKAEVNAHGPIWRVAEAAAAAFGGESCDTSILAMKAWPAAAYLGTIATVYALLRRLRPETAVRDTLLYAWNPYVLLEALQDGHNDIVAGLPALLAVWLAFNGRFRLALPLLAAAALIKPLAVVLGPLLLAAAWRGGHQQRRDAFFGMLLGAGLVIASYAPFWEGLDTLQGLTRADIFTDSPSAALVVGLQSLQVPPERAMLIGSLTATVFYALALLGLSFAVWRGRLPLIPACLSAFLLYALIGAQWFNPWYLLWLAPLTALVDGPPRRLGLLFMALAPLVYVFDSSTLMSVAVIFLPTFVMAWRYRAWLGWPGIPAISRRTQPAAEALGGRV